MLLGGAGGTAFGRATRDGVGFGGWNSGCLEEGAGLALECGGWGSGLCCMVCLLEGEVGDVTCRNAVPGAAEGDVTRVGFVGASIVPIVTGGKGAGRRGRFRQDRSAEFLVENRLALSGGGGGGSKIGLRRSMVDTFCWPLAPASAALTDLAVDWVVFITV